MEDEILIHRDLYIVNRFVRLPPNALNSDTAGEDTFLYLGPEVSTSHLDFRRLSGSLSEDVNPSFVRPAGVDSFSWA